MLQIEIVPIVPAESKGDHAISHCMHYYYLILARLSSAAAVLPLAAVTNGWHELWRGGRGWSVGERAARDRLARGEICDSAVPPALPGFLSP